MCKTVLLWLLAGLLLPAGALAGAPEPSRWEWKDGRWEQVVGPASQPISDETLDRAEEMIQAGQARAAKRILVAWIRTHQKSPIRDRAVFLLGQANHAYGERISAFYNFDEVLDLYPESRYYYPALQRQYEIADAYLKGHSEREFFFFWVTREEEATEMLYRIQQRAPGSPLAEKALLRAADYYYASSQYQLAADTYAFYVRSYPRSSVITTVRMRQAFATLAQFRGVKFDATPIIDARRQLLDLMEGYPVIAERENLPAIVQRVDAALAKKLFVTADFFRRTSKPKAAVYYFQYIVQNFPRSPEAEQSAQWLTKMPREAFEIPQPPTLEPARIPPSTQPAPNRERP